MAKAKRNTKGLVSFADRTTCEQREISKKGGERSGEVRRQNRDIAKWINKICGMDSGQEYQGVPLDNGGVIALEQIKKAKNGDTRAAEYVRDTQNGGKNVNVKTDNPVQLTIEEAKAIILALKKDL